MEREIILRGVFVVLAEDGTLLRVVAVELEGPWGRECFWRAGVSEEDSRLAKRLPPEEI